MHPSCTVHAPMWSSRVIIMGTPSRPSALFTLQTGKVETHSTPSAFKIRAMEVATSMLIFKNLVGEIRLRSVKGDFIICYTCPQP